MTDSISYRGPDGEGFLITCADEYSTKLRTMRPNALVVDFSCSKPVAFGHRRLSILDLNTNASQPMSDKSGRYWIVFNGEIYNHHELRSELVSQGFEFTTDHSDTEVILNAYACWGVECLKKFNGMWAFCLWDTHSNTYFLSRDRAGKKPLYYTSHKGVFYFSSELKAILVNNHLPRAVDPRAVFDYLTYMMVPAPSTIFNGISKLPAAHYLLIREGEAPELKRYWTPLSDSPVLDVTEKQAVEGIRDRIMEAARLRMAADVEVGVLLSGGLDSTINLACLSRFADRPIKAFSVGFENKNGYKNEFEFARLAAKRLNAEYHELTLTERDFFEFFPEMVYYQDEPIADTANIPIYYIARHAQSKGVKVLLGGEGSDELFVGYEHWRLSRSFGKIFEDRPVLARLASYLHAMGPFKNKRKVYHGWYEKVSSGKPSFWSGTELRTESQKRRILSSEFLHRIGNYSSFDPFVSLYANYKSLPGLDKYDWMTAVDLQYRLPDLLLARLDRMLMAASVEGRNPFLDVNVIEYAMKLPAELKTSGKTEKYILKKAFEGILPDEIIYRRKDSFTVPLRTLFNTNEYRQRTLEEVTQFNSREHVFSQEFMKGLAGNPNSAELWNVTNLAMWYNKFVG